MIKKILQEWIFINYCGQKIGQFNHDNLRGSLINALSGQITFILCIPLLYAYVLTGFREFIPILILIFILTYGTNYIFKKISKDVINMGELEKRYRCISRGKRIGNFVLALLSIILSLWTFILSMPFVRCFK